MKLKTTTEHVIEFSEQEVFEALAHWCEDSGQKEARHILEAAAATDKRRRITVSGTDYREFNEVPVTVYTAKIFKVHFNE